MKRFAIFVVVWLVSSVSALMGLNVASSASLTRTSGTIVLTCSQSYGQQGRSHDVVTGGVTGLVLPGSGDPSFLFPLRSASGNRFYVYKAAFAVSSTINRYAVVSIVTPRSATLYFGTSKEVGLLTDRDQGRGLIAAARTRVRLPVCGSRFTGYVGGIIVAKPTSVTFAVASPEKKTVRVTVSIGAN